MSGVALARTRGRLRTMWRPTAVFLSPGEQAQGDRQEGPIPASDQALLAWREWCLAHPGERCQVGLSHQWLLHGVVALSEAGSAEEARAVAARQWDHYFNVAPDLLAAQWAVRVTRAGAAWLLSAIPQELVNDVLAVAKAHGVQVCWMGPWWARVGQQWLVQALAGKEAPAQVLLGREPGWCVVMTVEGQALVGLAARAERLAPASAARPHQMTLSVADQAPACGRALWDDAQTRNVVGGRTHASGAAP